MTDLTKLESHFAFGDNWASYAERIGAREIDQAELGLRRLLATDSLSGRSFLDIGCGSGLHSLAAIRLGASRVVACDIDPISVRTTRAVLQKHALSTSHTVIERSVFELDPASIGTFDVVYSWGVLHHTGDLARALRIAASLVAEGGVFAFALYRKTLFCPIWKLGKKWYSKSSLHQQQIARNIYISAYRVRLRLARRNLATHIATYQSNRGMDFYHDVHDWLGGYPYESISPAQVRRAMNHEGLKQVRSFVEGNMMRRIGIFGSGCDEYVYERPGRKSANQR